MVEKAGDGFPDRHGTLKTGNKESLIKRFFKTIVWVDFRKNNKEEVGGTWKWLYRAVINRAPKISGVGGAVETLLCCCSTP